MLYWNQQTIKRAIGSAIWNTSEFFKIPLGRFAPIVFGWMIAAKRRNKSKSNGESVPKS